MRWPSPRGDLAGRMTGEGLTLDANPNRAGNPGATEATVASRVLCEVLLVAACLGQVVDGEWREVCKGSGEVDNAMWSGR